MTYGQVTYENVSYTGDCPAIGKKCVRNNNDNCSNLPVSDDTIMIVIFKSINIYQCSFFYFVLLEIL